MIIIIINSCDGSNTMSVGCKRICLFCWPFSCVCFSPAVYQKICYGKPLSLPHAVLFGHPAFYHLPETRLWSRPWFVIHGVIWCPVFQFDWMTEKERERMLSSHAVIFDVWDTMKQMQVKRSGGHFCWLWSTTVSHWSMSFSFSMFEESWVHRLLFFHCLLFFSYTYCKFLNVGPAFHLVASQLSTNWTHLLLAGLRWTT